MKNAETVARIERNKELMGKSTRVIDNAAALVKRSQELIRKAMGHKVYDNSKQS